MRSAGVCVVLCAYIAFLIAVIILARANNRRTVITDVVSVMIKMLCAYSLKGLAAYVTQSVSVFISVLSARCIIPACAKGDCKRGCNNEGN